MQVENFSFTAVVFEYLMHFYCLFVDRTGGYCVQFSQSKDALLAKAVPAPRLVGVAKDEVAVGALVPVFQGFHKLVVSIRLEVQGDSAGGVLACEDARESSGFVAGHESCTGNQAQEESLPAFTTHRSYRLQQGGVICSRVRQVSEGNEAPASV